jgi:hypothetical protein
MYGAPQNSGSYAFQKAVGERNPALQKISPSMYGNGNASMPQGDQAGLGSNRIPPIQIAQDAPMPVGLTSSQYQQSAPVPAPVPTPTPIAQSQIAPVAAPSAMFNDKQSGMGTPRSVAGIMQQSMSTQPQQRQASRMVS